MRHQPHCLQRKIACAVQEAALAAAAASRCNAASCQALSKQLSGIDTLAQQVRAVVCLANVWRVTYKMPEQTCIGAKQSTRSRRSIPDRQYLCCRCTLVEEHWTDWKLALTVYSCYSTHWTLDRPSSQPRPRGRESICRVTRVLT